MWRAIVATVIMSSPAAAFADSISSLTQCVADSTTGKQRKELARWIFLSMSSHPDLRQYIGTKAENDIEPTNKVTADLYVALISEQCAKEANAAFKEHGSAAIVKAFEVLGALAMQELMSNKETEAAMGAFEKYVDASKVQAALAR